MKNTFTMKWAALVLLVLMAGELPSLAQQLGTGCLVARWGVDADLYSGVIEFGDGVEPTSPPYSRDWFQGAQGQGLIDESNPGNIQTLLQNEANPTYERRMKYGLVSIQEDQILIDGLFAREHFGGTGHRDPTSYLTASKNGEDPAIWDPGEANVLGKNDIVDVGGHMFRDGLGLNSDLWFVGLFNMAEPGGTTYMDFEFYVDSVRLIDRPGVPGGILFTSGGPQLGHTAYTFDVPGNITKVGDFIFSVSISGASGPFVETRLWVSRADWDRLNGPTQGSTPTFQWAGTFDGAFNNAPFGYAGILPLGPDQVCAYLNMPGELPLAPPWGTKNTKTNTWGTNYIPYSVNEVAINLTAFGMDHSSLSGADPCFFPLNTFIIKTRASASFTAQLKDFAGPYGWGTLTADAEKSADISCDNPFPTVTAFPKRDDLTYLWSTVDGNFHNILPYAGNEDAKGFIVAFDDPALTDPINFTPTYLGAVPDDPWEVQVDKAGTYDVTVILPTDCPVQKASAVVGYDPTFPFFDGPPVFSYTVPCNDNDGTITVTAGGATKPYTFALYQDDALVQTFTAGPTQATHTFTGLTPGEYRVDVKGVYACIETTGPFTIPARIPVVITPTLTQIECFGAKTGAVNLLVTGGNPPLSYFWSTGNTSQNLLNVGAGDYTVIITDADGCETIETFTITQPDAVTADIAAVDDTNPDPAIGNGTITLSNISGGAGGYSFVWEKERDGVTTPAFSTDQNLTDLRRGKYTVTITDAKGCTFVISANVWEPEICDDGIDNSGNGLTDCEDPACGPVTPAGITPSHALPCVGDAVTYTVQLPAGVSYDSFVWTLPANTVITSAEPHTGPSITLYWTNTAGGQICVQGKVFACLSAPVCINVDVDDVPPPPGDITIDDN